VSLQDFLKCLNLYAQEIISRQELLNLAHVSTSSARALCGAHVPAVAGSGQQQLRLAAAALLL
jgi:hypothetical protein